MGWQEGWGRGCRTVAAALPPPSKGAQKEYTSSSPSGSIALWSQVKSKLAHTATGGSSERRVNCHGGASPLVCAWNVGQERRPRVLGATKVWRLLMEGFLQQRCHIKSQPYALAGSVTVVL